MTEILDLLWTLENEKVPSEPRDLVPEKGNLRPIVIDGSNVRIPECPVRIMRMIMRENRKTI